MQKLLMGVSLAALLAAGTTVAMAQGSSGSGSGSGTSSATSTSGSGTMNNLPGSPTTGRPQ